MNKKELDRIKDLFWEKDYHRIKNTIEHRRRFIFTNKINFNKTHQRKSLAVNKLGSIFHVRIKNLSGYILVHKKRICCLDFG